METQIEITRERTCLPFAQSSICIKQSLFLFSEKRERKLSINFTVLSKVNGLGYVEKKGRRKIE